MANPASLFLKPIRRIPFADAPNIDAFQARQLPAQSLFGFLNPHVNMAQALYMDVHVPLAITNQLRLRGVDALTSQEDNTRELPDRDLLDRASELGRIFFTQDIDLLTEASLRQRTGGNFVGVV